MKTRLFTSIGLIIIVLVALTPEKAQAQYYDTPRTNTNFQFGLGFIPGVGAQVGYIKPFEIVTAEATAYLNFEPERNDRRTKLNITGAVGGSIRFMRLLREFEGGYGPQFDVDLGFRVGPKIDLKFDSDTGSDRVSIAVDPFVRLATDLRSGNAAYVEIGVIEPYLRVGMFIPVY